MRSSSTLGIGCTAHSLATPARAPHSFNQHGHAPTADTRGGALTLLQAAHAVPLVRDPTQDKHGPDEVMNVRPHQTVVPL